MSVLACSREGCRNIMCDRYSYRHGYICDECFRELVESGPDTSIDVFMRSAKRKNQTRRDVALSRFDVEFPIE